MFLRWCAYSYSSDLKRVPNIQSYRNKCFVCPQLDIITDSRSCRFPRAVGWEAPRDCVTDCELVSDEAQVLSPAPSLTTWDTLRNHVTCLGLSFFSLKMSCWSRFDSIYCTEYLLCARHGACDVCERRVSHWIDCIWLIGLSLDYSSVPCTEEGLCKLDLLLFLDCRLLVRTTL